MSGVFLSYSRGDRALAERIIRGLRALGVDVWWDEDMPGVDWQEELERQISQLAGVIVIWTAHSAASKNVRDEARLGLSSDKLINVMVGAAQPPFPFDRVNGLPLDGWTGREPHKGWSRLVQTVEALIVKTGGAQAGDITGALARREKDLRLKQQAFIRAQETFQDAQGLEGEAVEAAKTAEAANDRAEEQLQRVAEMRASPRILEGAQQELETARAERDTAEQVLQGAKSKLSEASRALTRARTALESLLGESTETVDPAPPPAIPPAPEPTPAPPTPGPAPAQSAEPVPQPAPVPPPQPVPAPTPSSDLMARLSAFVSRHQLAALGVGAVAVLIAAVLLFPHPQPSPLSNASAPAGSEEPASAASAALAVPPLVAQNLSGTTWVGQFIWTDETETETLTFRPDGVLVYAYSGKTYDNGRWSQDGSSLTFNTNNHYADFQGQIQGDQINGTMTNVAHSTGTFSIARQ